MKYLIALLAALAAFQPALAQRHIGWYVGPTTAVSQFNDETAFITGVRGGVILDGRILLGVESNRLVNNIRADRVDAEGNRYVEFFFSGATAAYSFSVNDRFTYEARALVGGGEAHWRDGLWDGVVGRWNRDDDHTTSLIVVPGLDVRYAIQPWLQATLGGDYRFAAFGTSRVVRQLDMGGPSVRFALRFGRF